MAKKKEQFEVDLTIKEAKSDDVVKQMEENNQLEANQIILTQSGTEVPAMPVGSIFVSAIPLTDVRVHLLDGSTISQTGIYETFANLIKALVSSGQPISCTQAQFDADVTATGNCGKFVIDNGAGTIRLPKITTFIQGLSSITNIGSSLSAGLPNITGTDRGVASQSFGLSGAFYEKSMSGTGTVYQDATTDTSYSRTAFDASRSSAIYGKSSTVQPNATQYPYYIVLASGYKSSQVVDVDNVMDEINNNEGIKFAEREKLKTFNLFSSPLEQGSIASATGLLTESTTRVRTSRAIRLTAGTYTISNKDKYMYLISFDTNSNLVSQEFTNSWITTSSFTFTVTSERLLKFVFRNPTDTATIVPSDVKDVMLVKKVDSESQNNYTGNIIHEKNLTDYVVVDKKTSTGGFRKWASGLKEYWGQTTTAVADHTITFPEAFSGNTYGVAVVALTDNTASDIIAPKVQRSTSNIIVRMRYRSTSGQGSASVNISYYVIGY